ncbi:penicillin-binding protein [Deinococcus detaillensis]|uniref:peptidoglycan glycosyltransferase n=1 Tax=Deinococcus detaillensis TaxID=2592048 RepID=A0A553V5B2_9DEIO|nr:transglycosylase domain-containing protein [Deinococcus detaillensis]TSA87574.1 penicillin-binding protein [Deinococcus detaillensis]
MSVSPLFTSPRRPALIWRLLRWLLAGVGIVTVLTLLTGLAGAALTGSLSKTWNLKDQIEPIRVLDNKGNDMGVIDHCDEVQGQQPSNPVPCRETLTLPLSAVSKDFLLAYISKEDVRYFQHPGIDLGRIPKSLLSRAGGSTLTMQLLKNNVLAGHFDYDTGRTGVSRDVAGIFRKAAEYVLAPLLSLRYSKAEVLEMSVNSLPWLGIGQRKGIHDAARIMFGVSASDLTLAQSAFLVGLLPRPGTYLVTDKMPLTDSTERFRTIRAQQLLTLGVLHVHNLITDDQYAQAVGEQVQPSLWKVDYAGFGPNLMVARASRNPDYRSDPDPAWTLQALVKRELQQSGISPARAATVTLTIDAQAQRDLNARVSENRANVGEGAAVINVADGGILALSSSTGGNLSGESGQQWAVSARRPVASTVKPLLYSAAFGQGAGSLNQLSRFRDQPTSYYGQAIGNNTGTFLNQSVTVREADTRSLNTVAVQVGLQYQQPLTRALSAVGYTKDAANTSSPALGTWRASPLQVAGAYASFANGGSWCPPHLLAAVYDASGRRLSLPPRSCVPLWDSRVAYQTFDMLTAAVSGDASHVKFLRPSFFSGLLGSAAQLGAKSGTSDNVNDTWCAGVTPEYAMAVWLGDPSGVSAVPTDLYRHQAACREISFLRQLPHTLTELPMPAGLRRVDGAAVPEAGITLQNPPQNPAPTPSP